MAISSRKRSLPKLNDSSRPKYLTVDADADGSDHALGPLDANITLVEYGSYASAASEAAHEIVASLHTRFDGQMRYVFRHLLLSENKMAWDAAVPRKWIV